ncbi:hypothetical protein BY996DRAFT_7055391 [Phakopsora pachyrhizi]|nr:hypothetical protein BY996DRAFT_7055391 [Phakopsora pachyrhizi]
MSINFILKNAEYAIENMVKRVNILLKEEYASALDSHLDSRINERTDEPRLNRFLTSSSSHSSTPGSNMMIEESILKLLGQTLIDPKPKEDKDHNESDRLNHERDFSSKSFNLKPIFIEAVQELYDELELVREGVAAQAAEHIHSGEVIMTCDNSRTVKSFLRSAAKSKRTFTVMVSETSPTFSGIDLARSLNNSNPPISTLVVSDSSTFGLMSRCTKLIIGCHIVFADGSILARSGSLGLALAAKAHLVPVVVVCGMYKFSDVYPRAGQDWSMMDMKNPDEVLLTSEIESDGIEDGKIEVLNPYYDRVPADLINLFITNLGGHPSSFVYRLLKDLYGSA